MKGGALVRRSYRSVGDELQRGWLGTGMTVYAGTSGISSLEAKILVEKGMKVVKKMERIRRRLVLY